MCLWGNSMANLNKLEKAEKLVELTGSVISRRKFDSSTPKKHVDLRRALEEDSRELQIELRTKHYSEEQLDALLDFYESEIGKSILQANERIRVEFSDGYREFGKNLAMKLDGSPQLAEIVTKNSTVDRDDDS